MHRRRFGWDIVFVSFVSFVSFSHSLFLSHHGFTYFLSELRQAEKCIARKIWKGITQTLFSCHFLKYFSLSFRSHHGSLSPWLTQHFPPIICLCFSLSLSLLCRLRAMDSDWSIKCSLRKEKSWINRALLEYGKEKRRSVSPYAKFFVAAQTICLFILSSFLLANTKLISLSTFFSLLECITFFSLFALGETKPFSDSWKH